MIDYNSVPYLATSTFKLIHNRINLARRTRENVAITGSAGVGKTIALKSYVEAEDFGIAHFFPVTRDLGKSAGTLYEVVAESVGTTRAANPASTMRAIKKRLKEAFWDYSTPCLLVFDEAQNIKLETMRDLLTLTEDDDTFVTIVFAGNADVLKVVNTENNKFKSMGRRCQFQMTIDGVTHEDADLMADAFEVRDGACLRLLRAISEKDHISGVVTVLKIAREIAEAKPIAIDHLRASVELLPQFRYALPKR